MASGGNGRDAGGFPRGLPVPDHVREQPTPRPDDVLNELKGFRHRSDHRQTMIFDDVKQRAHRGAGNDAAVDPRPLMFVVERQQLPKTV